MKLDLSARGTLAPAQARWPQAEQDMVNARYDYHIARAELEALVEREL